MKHTTKRMLGGAILAGVAAAVTFALAPVGHATPTADRLTGGVSVSMADGSVRFVRDAIDSSTWRSLGSRSGGEVLSGD